MTSAVLREDMKKGNVEMERRIYISLPKESDHTVHKLGIVSRNIITVYHCVKNVLLKESVLGFGRRYSV